MAFGLLFKLEKTITWHMLFFFFGKLLGDSLFTLMLVHPSSLLTRQMHPAKPKERQ